MMAIVFSIIIGGVPYGDGDGDDDDGDNNNYINAVVDDDVDD